MRGCACRRSARRHEVRRGRAGRGGGRRSPCTRSARTALCSRRARLIGKTEIAGAGKPPAFARSSWRGSSPAMSRKTSLRRDIAAAVAGEGVRVDRAFTGRANLFAETAGVLVVDQVRRSIAQRSRPRDHLCDADAYAPVVAGKMVATVKIIPFAVTGAARDKAVAVARDAKPLVRVAPYRIERSASISTLLPGARRQGDREDLAGHRRAAGARRARASSPSGACRMSSSALAKALDEVLAAGAELVIVFGASAIADRRDVIPAAIEAVGGTDRAFRHAGRSRQSDADRRMPTAARCSARRAARARRRRTASTGC